jgi:hypothetical protein
MAREFEVFLQERAGGYYRPTAYYIIKVGAVCVPVCRRCVRLTRRRAAGGAGRGQVLFDALPLRILPTMILGTLVYFMCGLQWAVPLYFHFVLILILFNIVTALICLTISALVRRNSLANLAAIVLLLFFSLFQGVFLNFGLQGPRPLTHRERERDRDRQARTQAHAGVDAHPSMMIDF